MTSHPDNLTSAVFKALYLDYDLMTIGGAYVVVPAGSLVLTGSSLGHIARQIADRVNPPGGLGDQCLLWEDALPRRASPHGEL